jgi:hypothetical protein
MTFFKKLIRDEAGATAIEYGLIAALIADVSRTNRGAAGQPAAPLLLCRTERPPGLSWRHWSKISRGFSYSPRICQNRRTAGMTRHAL